MLKRSLNPKNPKTLKHAPSLKRLSRLQSLYHDFPHASLSALWASSSLVNLEVHSVQPPADGSVGSLD